MLASHVEQVAVCHDARRIPVTRWPQSHGNSNGTTISFVVVPKRRAFAFDSLAFRLVMQLLVLQYVQTGLCAAVRFPPCRMTMIVPILSSQCYTAGGVFNRSHWSGCLASTVDSVNPVRRSFVAACQCLIAQLCCRPGINQTTGLRSPRVGNWFLPSALM